MTNLTQYSDKIKENLLNIVNIFVLSFIFTFAAFLPATAQNKTSPKSVAVFGISTGNTADITLTTEAADYIKKIFTDCGRFLPVAKGIDAAYNKAKIESVKNEKDLYNLTAKLLNVDIYVLVSSYQLGNLVYAEIETISLNQEYRSIEKKFRLRSGIKLNIPLKAGKEIALLHKNLSLTAEIIKAYENDLYLINAGEWHGIKDNAVYKSPQRVQIIQTGRFDSIVKISENRKEGEKILIKIFPDVEKIAKELDKDISRNTISRYELENTPEKRLLEGICFINMGSNMCLPGYGAFLSTSYLGFKDPKPDWTGVALSTSAIATQLLLSEIMTDFKSNFLPWKKDADKPDKTYDLQKFLWLTLPVTFSVAYMDQLANLFNATGHIPPFFIDKDNTAAIFSLFLPGGGHFYKGRRIAGWSFYFSEMATAGYAVYEKNNSGKYALFAFGAIKLFDIISAYITRPAFSFYNIEKEREIEPVSLNFGMIKSPGNYNIFNAFVSTLF